MVDVGGKPVVRRRAVARGRVRMARGTTKALGDLPKGDALVTAKLAGIMAAKRTSELVPLCHPLPLTYVDVALEVTDDSVEIEASTETTAQTGVEMEALTAVSVAALTLYDMAKAIDNAMVIDDASVARHDRHRSLVLAVGCRRVRKRCHRRRARTRLPAGHLRLTQSNKGGGPFIRSG